ESVLGSTLRIRGVPFTVVGVAERRFRGVWSPNLIAADMWISLSEARRLPGWLKALQDRDAGRLMVVARLKPGMDLPSARMDTAASVFAVIGGMVALALALPAVTALGRWSTTLAAEVRLSIDAAPDWKVFAYCALCSVIAAFASGVLPGLRASQQSPVRQLG